MSNPTSKTAAIKRDLLQNPDQPDSALALKYSCSATLVNEIRNGKRGPLDSPDAVVDDDAAQEALEVAVTQIRRSRDAESSKEALEYAQAARHLGHYRAVALGKATARSEDRGELSDEEVAKVAQKYLRKETEKVVQEATKALSEPT